MSISSAMYTGLTGLNSNGEAMAVVGDNIANLSTTGFKYSQVAFEDLMAQMISTGSGPGQVGRGGQISEITPIFSQGSLQTSADDVDCAITGTGFFIVKDSSSTGNLFYTRDGNFSLDKDGYLVTAHGYNVQGKTIDRTTGTATGTDVDIVIQQNFSPPSATSSLDMVMNLDSTSVAGDTYTTALSVYDTTGNAHSLNMTYTKQAGVAAVESVVTGAGSTAGLAGSYWTISSPSTNYYVWYTVDGAGADPAPAGRTAIPVAVLSTDTAIQVATKTATALNAVTGTPFTASNGGTATIAITDTANGPATAPAAGTTPAGWGTYSQTTTGVGDHDWLPSATLDGTAVTITDVGGGGPSNMVFDDNGNLTSSGQYSLNLWAFNIGDATTHLTTLNLKNTSGGSTTQYAASSVTNYASQNGYGPGYLQRVSINTDGIITGHYSNGQITPLYQFDLARFNAPTKLHREGANMYSETQDSGVPLTGAPGNNGLGKINSNSLEQSNVDLGEQFVHMILYQRAFQANSRIITTSDTLLEEVLNLKR